MDVILLERIEHLGQMGDVVKVRPGFARNFLFPQKKALRVSDENRAYFDSKRTELEAMDLKRRDEAEAVAKKMDGVKIALVRQAGEGGQLYGSVTARDVADALTEEGYHVDRRQVMLGAAVKALGVHKTDIRLHPEVRVEITFTVARSLDEADLKAAEAAQLLERVEDAAKLMTGEAPEEEAATDAAAAAPEEAPEKAG